MITTNTHATAFLNAVKGSGSGAPAVLLDRLFTHFGPATDVEVHFTGAGGADLRAYRTGAGRTEQNIFTMVWRHGGYFDCNIFCAINAGGPVSNVRLVDDPLPNAFSFDPAMPGLQGSAATVLIEMIESAVAGWV